MDNAEKIDAALRACAKRLGTCAEMILNANLEPVRKNVTRIGYALTYIFEIQNEIYKNHPELQPEELKNPKLDPRNKIYGNLLIEVCALCEEGRPQVALEKLDAFIASQPGVEFEEMAKGEISSIREQFNV